MSERLGLLDYGCMTTDEVFIGRDLAHTRSYGEEIASMIDEEVKRLIDDDTEEKLRRCSKRMSRYCTIVRSCLWRRKRLGREEFEALFERNISISRYKCAGHEATDGDANIRLKIRTGIFV